MPAEADITRVCGHRMPLGRHDAELGLPLEAVEQTSSSSGDEGPAPKKTRVGTSSEDDGSSAPSKFCAPWRFTFLTPLVRGRKKVFGGRMALDTLGLDMLLGVS